MNRRSKVDLPSSARESRALSLDRISPNPRQPRQTFDPGSLEELKESIRSLGVMVPIIVRPTGDRFEIVCGERRFRAATELGLATIPAIVRPVDEFTALRMAYEENVKRDDLTVLDEARFLQGLLQNGFAATRTDLAGSLGISKGRVTQKLAVLTLPSAVQEAFGSHGFLGELHARALGQLPDARQQERLIARVVREELSGRQTEALVQKSLERRPVQRARKGALEYHDGVMRRTRTGYVLRLPLLPPEKLALILAHWARGLRYKMVKLPPESDAE